MQMYNILIVTVYKSFISRWNAIHVWTWCHWS